MTRARHAVVTGASSGIGRAVATRLIAEGWRVTGLDRAPATIASERFEALAADLSDARSRHGALASLAGVRALVHCAGVMRGGRLGALEPADGELLWRVNVEAATALANHLVPLMADGGRVVLIGSRAARGVAGRSQYAAAKAALVALARSWAGEVVDRGITVNVVAPAATDTQMLADPARAGTPPVLPPLGRLIRPEEVAALVAFLLGENAAAITGQEIAICGGASL